MNKNALIDGFGWGFGLWLVGYLLGIVCFMLVPTHLIGWVITPIGLTLTLWVLLKKVHAKKLSEFVMMAIIWTAIAIVLDYLCIVKLLKPADGYYKVDVYLYYTSTLLLPPIVGWYKSRVKRN